MCISLCEDYIAAHLLQWFLQTSATPFDLTIDIVTPATPSPFKPFFLTFTKLKSSAVPSPRAQVYFNSFGSPTKAPASLSLPATAALIKQAHVCNQKRFQLSKVEPGRYEVFDVHAESNSSVGDAGPLPPRFSIIIFDHTERAARSCAVFFVPPGRETDYQFTSESGLAELASQAQCRRLLAVRCNRPHVFPPMADLQSELSPLALYLAPADTGPSDEDPIPFMAVQEESDWETVADGELAVAGAYVVEEMGAEDEADSEKFVWRRLLFLQNQHFVQTEAKLLHPSHVRKSASSKKKKGAKGAGKGKGKQTTTSSNGDDELYLFDHSYLDDHHKAMLTSLLCDNTDIISTGSQPRSGATDDINQVKALLIGLGGGALAMALQRYLPSLRLDVVDLVPGLDDLATKYFGFVAGPRCRSLVQDGVQYIMEQGRSCEDGLKSGVSPSVFTAVEQQSSSSDKNASSGGACYHSILLDVDSKDNSLGVSAPPAAFLEPSFLQHLHDKVLLPGGSLCVNVVARDKSKLADLVAQLKAIFCTGDNGGKVYKVKPSSDTVNLTVHAVKGNVGAPLHGLAKQLQTLAVSSQSVKNKNKKSASGVNSTLVGGSIAEMKARERGLDAWLAVVGLSSDKLALHEVVDHILDA